MRNRRFYEMGSLVANGPYLDEIEGLYIFAVRSEDGVFEISDADPAVTDGKLKTSTIAPWLVVMDGFARPQPEGTSYFVLEYSPGPEWKAGEGLAGQEIGPHMDYVGGLFEQGKLIAGGPIPATDRGRYIIATANLDEARALVDADPGAKSGLFMVETRPWSPAQRQSLHSSLEKLGRVD